MERRELVLEVIEKNPGIRFNEIMRITNMKNGTLSHYVKKLEDENFIELERNQEIVMCAGCELMPQKHLVMEDGAWLTDAWT